MIPSILLPSGDGPVKAIEGEHYAGLTTEGMKHPHADDHYQISNVHQTPRKLKPPAEADHYAVLGIDRSASPVDLKKAFRSKVLTHHPDKKSGTHEEMIKVSRFYPSIFSSLTDTI